MSPSTLKPIVIYYKIFQFHKILLFQTILINETRIKKISFTTPFFIQIYKGANYETNFIQSNNISFQSKP